MGAALLTREDGFIDLFGQGGVSGQDASPAWSAQGLMRGEGDDMRMSHWGRNGLTSDQTGDV